MRTARSKATILLLIALLAGCSKKAPQFGFSIQEHEVTVSIFLSEHRLEATDQLRVTLKAKDEIRFLLNENLTVQRVRVAGRDCKFAVQREFDAESLLPKAFREDTAWVRRAALVSVFLPKFERPPERLEVAYQGVIFDSTEGGEFSHTRLFRASSGLISARGVFLTPASLWYPIVPGELSSIRLTVRTPAPFEIVSQGALRQRKVQEGWVHTVWDERQPQEGIYLAAGQWRITQLPLMRYSVMSYFSPETATGTDLERRFVEACAGYINLYERLLGPYPYAKFAVVENAFPTGYGFPSFTLLGSEVIRLPFIIQTSLGHEVCHSWWGNAVYVAPGTGNWCEGLTTYCADLHYAEQQGPERAARLRMGLLRDYLSYVTVEKDFPLRDFRERNDPASRAIGYGKAAMVFHQLRLLLGDEKFWNALRSLYRDYRFRYASWDDLRKVFEEFHGQKLDWFFNQWLEQAGAPMLQAPTARVARQGDRYQVTLVLRQQGSRTYRLRIPVRVRTTAGSEQASVDLAGAADSVTVRVVNKPVLAEVDPGFEVFRRLLPGEYPVALSQLLGEPKPVCLLASSEPGMAEAYRLVAEELLRDTRGQLVSGSQLDPASLRDASVAIFGDPRQSGIWETLRTKLPAELQIQGSNLVIQGTEYNPNLPGLAVVFVVPSPFHPEKVVATVWGGSPEAVRAIMPKLWHYGRYSFLVFQNGRSVASGEWQVTESPMAVRL